MRFSVDKETRAVPTQEAPLEKEEVNVWKAERQVGADSLTG